MAAFLRDILQLHALKASFSFYFAVFNIHLLKHPISIFDCMILPCALAVCWVCASIVRFSSNMVDASLRNCTYEWLLTSHILSSMCNHRYWGVLSSALHLLHSSHLWYWRTLKCPPLTRPSYSFFECRTSLFETLFFKPLNSPSTFLHFASVNFSLIYVINEYEKQRIFLIWLRFSKKNQLNSSTAWNILEVQKKYTSSLQEEHRIFSRFCPWTWFRLFSENSGISLILSKFCLYAECDKLNRVANIS